MLSSQGYSYDSGGNTTADPSGRTFVYDAENKQTSVSNGSGSIGQYWYDGDGKRIKKIVPATGETTVFVYDASGKLVAEYSTIVANSTDAKVSYLTSDTLGSPRINTDQNGAIIARHDYMPFGEEIATSQRTGNGYNDDTVRKQFTGYERDGETDLDFAQARYFDAGFGRFSSPDDFKNDSDVRDPQSWNKYVYVRNNPTSLIDPSGQKADIDIQVDQKTHTITLTITASIGIWATPGKNFKPDLEKVRKNIEAQIKKWGGSTKIAGDYTLNVNANITVKAFDSARSTDDVLKSDNSIMNVIQLVDHPASKECGAGANSCSGSGDPATINNPDGSLPDIGTWRYTTARDKNEPAHEFFHLLGISHNSQEMYGPGWTGIPFAEQGTTQTVGATLYDYTRAFHSDVDAAITESKREDNKWWFQSKRDVVVRPTRIATLHP